jgi:hypothetical protein
MPISPDKTLVMGLAANYLPSTIAIFLASLDAAGFRGTLVLFVTGEMARHRLPHTKYRLQLAKAAIPARLRGMSWNAVRYYFYLDYLKSPGRAFEDIFLTDTRDVFFQRDPFASPTGGELLVTFEDASKVIGSCSINSMWILNRFGRKVYERLKTQRISCSGTTRGTRTGMLAYLCSMCAQLYPYLPAPYMEGYDQGVHNRIVHEHQVKGIVCVDNAGPILTLHYTDDRAIRIDDDGQVLNTAGAVAHVVHQFDRKPRLVALARERFGDFSDRPARRGAWYSSPGVTVACPQTIGAL